MSTDIAKKEASPPAPVPMIGGSAAPQDLDGAFRIAKLFHMTGMLPQGVNTPEQALVALMAGMECGLSPTQSLQNVMVVNKRPTIWGDAAIGLVWASDKMESHTEGIEGDGDKRVGVCTVKRRGDGAPYTVRFSVDDAIKAGLWKKAGPWTQYPDRMLKLRARAFALRDKFADVLKGLGIREEVEDFEPRRVVATLPSDQPGRPSLAERLQAADAPDAGAGHAPPAPAPVKPGDDTNAAQRVAPKFDRDGNLIEQDIDDVLAAASPNRPE